MSKDRQFIEKLCEVFAEREVLGCLETRAAPQNSVELLTLETIA
jgi:hypothetical protein